MISHMAWLTRTLVDLRYMAHILARAACLSYLIDYTPHARSYYDLNQPITWGFSPIMSSLMSLPDGLTGCGLGKEVWPVFYN